GPAPRPVVDLDLLDRAQVASRLPDPHCSQPFLVTRARVPTREGNVATRRPRPTLPAKPERVCADPASIRILMRQPPGRPAPRSHQPHPRTDARAGRARRCRGTP